MSVFITEEAVRLREQHGGFWGEHPKHHVEDWRWEAANDDTRLGYWEWVAAREDNGDD